VEFIDLKTPSFCIKLSLKVKKSSPLVDVTKLQSNPQQSIKEPPTLIHHFKAKSKTDSSKCMNIKTVIHFKSQNAGTFGSEKTTEKLA
jgi:hypothetical protein